MLHGIRQIVNNDSLWREMFRSMNRMFWHQTVTTKQIEKYLSDFLGRDLQKTFDQYLRTVQIPVLEYKLKNGKLSYRWTNCVKGFNMPINIISTGKEILIKPLDKWQSLPYADPQLAVDPDFFVTIRKTE